MPRTVVLSRKEVGSSLEKPWLSGLWCTRPPKHVETTYFEKTDTPVTGGRRKVLIIVKVNVAQVPGMCKLLATPVKNPRAAQVPAW